MKNANATPKVHATSFDGLAFTSHRAGEWGYCDPSNAFDMFGPRYATREQLVADLARFGAEFTGQQTPATSSAPQTEVVDLTADLFSTREALLAAHERINTLATRYTLTDRALDASLDYIATLTAKAAALDALVEAAGKVSWMPEAGYVVTDAPWDALRAALSAAKAAQASK